MMKPSIPQHESRSDARAAEIAERRERYRYDYSWPPGVATSTELHLEDQFSPQFLAHVGELNVAIFLNRTRLDLQDLRLPEEGIASIRELFASLDPAIAHERFWHSAREHAAAAARRAPEVAREYLGYFAHFDRPPLVERLIADPGQADLLCGWQRIAGANPMVIRRLDALPDHFPVTEAHVAALGEGDSLARALAEGRLFLADYAILDGAELGEHRGQKKHAAAAMALFAQTAAGFIPVAIQLGQRPGLEAPIWTPRDGYRWSMAKHFLGVADGCVHQGIEHLGRTHLVMQAVAMGVERNLAAAHPLRVLLAPHYELTMAINDTAKHNLIAPGGTVEQVLAPTLASTLAVVKAGIESFVLQDAAPPRALAARGLLDREALPVFPYRDDALRIWEPIRAFADSYVRLYYSDDAAVRADPELRAWMAELGATDGGRLRGVRPVETIADLAELVAIIIFIAGPQHAAVNFSQWPFMSYAPNMVGAAFAAPPSLETPDSADAYDGLLPPWDIAVLTADTVYQLSHLRFNQLGAYPWLHFDDERVAPLVDALRAELARVEAEIREAEAGRLLPYPFLLPSNVPRSIHI